MCCAHLPEASEDGGGIICRRDMSRYNLGGIVHCWTDKMEASESSNGMQGSILERRQYGELEKPSYPCAGILPYFRRRCGSEDRH